MTVFMFSHMFYGRGRTRKDSHNLLLWGRYVLTNKFCLAHQKMNENLLSVFFSGFPHGFLCQILLGMSPSRQDLRCRAEHHWFGYREVLQDICLVGLLMVAWCVTLLPFTLCLDLSQWVALYYSIELGSCSPETGEHEYYIDFSISSPVASRHRLEHFKGLMTSTTYIATKHATSNQPEAKQSCLQREVGNCMHEFHDREIWQHILHGFHYERLMTYLLVVRVFVHQYGQIFSSGYESD